MNPKSNLSQMVILAAALLILGGLGAYWPRWVGSAAAISNNSPDAIIGDGITYQGYLTDPDGTPLDGAFTMRFEIYNGEEKGTLLWDSGDVAVLVTDGLFEARLEITTDIFNGEELWVAQTVNGELLTPRQEILPAPMAHTLRPGAIVKGTANALSNNYLLEVDMNNDELAFNRGAIFGQTTTGNAIYGRADNGRAIYGQTQNGYGVYGFDGGTEANQGYGGYFYSTNGIGVYGFSSADRSHPNILAPGVYGQSNQGVGVYGRGDTSDSHTFYNEGGYFEGGRGIYALGTDGEFEGGSSLAGYGGRFYSSEYRALYARGDSDDYDAHFDGGVGILVDGVVARSASDQTIVANLGDTSIEAGDLVAIVGVAYAPATGEPMLAVAKVDETNRDAVIGVAALAFSADVLTHDDGRQTNNFSEAGASAAPKGYLSIITEGLAPAVNLTSLTRSIELPIGSKLVLNTNGMIRAADNDTGSIVLGKVAGPIDEQNGTIPLFVDID